MWQEYPLSSQINSFMKKLCPYKQFAECNEHTFLKVMSRYRNSASNMYCFLACWSADMILPIMLLTLINTMRHWEMWWSCKVKNLETMSEDPGKNFFAQFCSGFSQTIWFPSPYLKMIWENKSRKGGEIVILPADCNFTGLLVAKIRLSALNWWLIFQTA